MWELTGLEVFFSEMLNALRFSRPWSEAAASSSEKRICSMKQNGHMLCDVDVRHVCVCPGVVDMGSGCGFVHGVLDMGKGEQ